MNNLYDTVASLSYFSNLTLIIKKANMVGSLKRRGPFTLFGPHDGAFDTFTTYDPNDIAHEYPVITLQESLKSEKEAREILNNLLVNGVFTLEVLKKLTGVTTINGQTIPIETTNGNIIPGNSYLMNSDIECTNGIIQVTGSVLRPTI